MEAQKEKCIDQYLIVFFLSLVGPLLLYFNRHLDDNRLVSWNWVFGDAGIYKLLILLGLSLLAAFGATRIRLQWRPFYLFVVSFLATVCFWSEPEVIVDAARYFTLGKQLKMYGVEYFFSELGRTVFVWTDLPLVPMLYGLVFKVFGENRIWIQLLNSLFFSGTVMLTYKLGEALWHEKLGRYAGFLLLGFPYIYTQVPLMLVDIPSMFFLMLAVFSFTTYLLHGGRIRFLTAFFAILFAVLAKYSLWLYLSILVVVLGIFVITKQNRVIVRCALVFGGVLLVTGLLYLVFHGVVNSQINLLTSYQKPGLKRWGESFVSTFLFQTHPLLTLTALLSVAAAVIKRDMRYLIISFLVILLVLMQIKRSRYAIPVFPMLALMSSYGIMQLQFPEIRKLIAACIIFTSFFFSLGGYLPFLNRMSAKNLQNAGKYLDEQKIASAGVVPLPQKEQILNPVISIPLLDIFSKADLLLLSNQEVETVDQRKIATSSLRFTWEYPLPSYYMQDDRGSQPQGLVIVESQENQTVPLSTRMFVRKFKHKKTFNISTGWFTHTTIVTVYH
jgi:Dolichyl-phosphate-mannose-protein mannosyltransferase